MKVLIQRVSSAVVRVDSEVVGSIQQGLLVLLGIEKGDNPSQTDFYARKLAGLRIFNDGNGMMNLDIQQVEGSVLLISQFTLAGTTRKGRRPSWDGAERPERAAPMCDRFVESLRSLNIPVQTGRFGAHMQVESIKDGPVTLLLDPPPSGLETL